MYRMYRTCPLDEIILDSQHSSIALGSVSFSKKEMASFVHLMALMELSSFLLIRYDGAVAMDSDGPRSLEQHSVGEKYLLSSPPLISLVCCGGMCPAL